MPDVYLRSIEPLIAIVLGCMRWKSANRIETLTRTTRKKRRGTTMVDRSGLRLVGFIFASVTFAVMLTTTMVVKGYSDGVYSLESAAIEGR
jgi:hypothetical protein